MKFVIFAANTADNKVCQLGHRCLYLLTTISIVQVLVGLEYAKTPCQTREIAHCCPMATQTQSNIRALNFEYPANKEKEEEKNTQVCSYYNS